MVRAINIVSFDIPYPPNYGGVIDVYHKLRWLHKKGIEIHLHCFEYGRQRSQELNKICSSVTYYKRKTGIASQLSSLPYTVKSRQSEELAANLLKNEHPILFEVLHTCYLLRDVRFIKRIKIYRHSNIEHEYYRHLAKSEKNMLKKYYLTKEAAKLEKFEPIVDLSNYILAVNEDDAEYFKTKYKKPKTVFLPSFHENDELRMSEGKGEYILYHGNLSVAENALAALWLAENVFSKLDHPCVIAGLNPRPDLLNELTKFKNIKVVTSPGDQEMDSLIKNAHIHCLYTDQNTGLKLKLLNCLFSGRFIVTNATMLHGTGLSANESLVISERYVDEIKELMKTSFTQKMLAERKQQLQRFDNSKNADKLIETIFHA